MVLLLNERGPERPATAVRSRHGVSVQPDTPTFVWRRLPRGISSCRGQTSACSPFVSGKGRMSRVSGSYTLCSPFERAITARSPPGMSIQPDIPIFVTMPSPSLAWKGEMENFRPMRGM